MPQEYLKFQDVTFTYESAVEPLFRGISMHLPSGWTGIVGANGSGKSTFLKLAVGLIKPDTGVVAAPLRAVYCPQRTDYPPEQHAALLDSNSKEASLIRGRLGVEKEWLERWPTLSHGERKRVQIAVALWLEPDVLAIDEPTNHVDAEARNVLITALQKFQGVGLLVSHDRYLIDTLCSRCIFIESPYIAVRPGGYSKGKDIATAEHEAIRREFSVKRHAYKKLKQEAGRRRELSNQKQSKLSKRGIPRHDHDARAKIDAARLSGKDAVGGKLLRQLEGRMNHLKVEIDNLNIAKQPRLGIWLPGSISQRNILLNLAPHKILLGENKQLAYPMLVVRPTDRIAITGANGCGKSTLVRLLLQHLNVPPEHITYVPQEIDLQQCRDILMEVQDLPHDQLGYLMTIISRLGSCPERLLESMEPSPGETRKLLLALGMTRKPHIIIMDEPTNHMDLPSIECLENALADCPCSLLLVSHDQNFLGKLTKAEWRILREKGKNIFNLRIL